ncbi:MAG TPA: serine/threonine-protein kinase [Kofleriaceae bacterium]
MSDSFGTWQLDALVAVGGLGEIWRATRDDLSEAVALKRLHTHLLRNDEARDQFAREQQLATTLPPHPNVVRGLESGVVVERPYLAMELVPGGDLRRQLMPDPRSGEKASPFDKQRALAIVRAACDAASHLHANGWVHGDINPSNLVVDGDRIVLIDLGIARPIGEAGTPRGTHAYMAPEQVRGQAWTPATDVFALGVVLWELSARTRLFHRGPSYLSMQAVIDFEPPALPDRDLDAIARAALAKDAAQRIATPRELADRLSGN